MRSETWDHVFTAVTSHHNLNKMQTGPSISLKALDPIRAHFKRFILLVKLSAIQ